MEELLAGGAHDPAPAVDVSASRARDRLMALGFIGVHGVGAAMAVILVTVPEPHHWWHWPVGGAVLAISVLPLVAGVGLLRHHRAVAERARHRHNSRAFGV